MLTHWYQSSCYFSLVASEEKEQRLLNSVFFIRYFKCFYPRQRSQLHEGCRNNWMLFVFLFGNRQFGSCSGDVTSRGRRRVLWIPERKCLLLTHQGWTRKYVQKRFAHRCSRDVKFQRTGVSSSTSAGRDVRGGMKSKKSFHDNNYNSNSSNKHKKTLLFLPKFLINLIDLL